MRVDFYQLTHDPVEAVIPRIAARLLGSNERLMVIAADNLLLDRISGPLWNAGAESFLANGKLGEGDEDRQPILLGGKIDRANGAGNLVFADGEWRDPPEGVARIFHFFTAEQADVARDLWRTLKDKVEEQHYWAQEDGRWVEKG